MHLFLSFDTRVSTVPLPPFFILLFDIKTAPWLVFKTPSAKNPLFLSSASSGIPVKKLSKSTLKFSFYEDFQPKLSQRIQQALILCIQKRSRCFFTLIKLKIVNIPDLPIQTKSFTPTGFGLFLTYCRHGTQP